jgi:hypothetical protein
MRKASSVVQNKLELDSHADTCCAGANTAVLEYTGEKVNVAPFSGTYKPMADIPIATVGTVWEDPKSGDTRLLVLNETLYFGDKMAETLVCPNQLRANGLIVSEVPVQFDDKSRHSIYIPKHELDLPLRLEGVISFLNTRKPTKEEIATLDRVELTSATKWEPYSEEFAEREAESTRATAAVSRKAAEHAEAERYIAMLARQESSRSPAELMYAEENELFERLVSVVNVSSTDIAGDGMSGRSDEDLYPLMDEYRAISGLSTEQRKSVITKEILARRWGIGLDTAHRTLTATTQMGLRRVLHPTERRYRTRQSHLRFPNLNMTMYTDTMFATVKSTRGNTCAQIFTDGQGFDTFDPMKGKGEAPDALMKVIRNVGIMKDLVSDGAPEETRGRWEETVNEFRIRQKRSEPYSQWQNRAESSIREIKKGIKRATRRANSPMRLWDYCGEWVAAIRRLTAHPIPSLNDRVPAERIEGNTPDISEYAQFDWYEHVWYIDPSVQFPEDQKRLGRWIGVAHDVGQAMTSWVLPASCRPIARSSVTPLTEDERQNPDIQERLQELDEAITARIGDKTTRATNNKDLETLFPTVPDDIYADDDDSEPNPDDMPEADDFTPESLDEYLTAEVLLPLGGDVTKARVIGRKRDADGNPVGRRNNNPILDTREYEVEFPDGSTDVFTANTIAESMYSQIDDEGNSFAIMDAITDHKSDGSALTKDDGFVEGPNGQRTPKMSTKGWKLEVSWKDGSTDWVPLKDLKESNPIEVAEYAVANKIAEEPAFAWWVYHVLKKRDRILKKVKSRYWKRTHKYGIRLPKSVDDALRIDKETATTFWKDAIEKEMKNVGVAFEFRIDDVMPVGYKHIDCHMIFDVKIDLIRKARYVAGGHQTEAAKDMTFASVVSRDSVRIAFLSAALNDLDILAADVQNAYLNAPTTEKVYTTAGKEFGKDAGRPVLIVRALYGLKSSGARWRDHISGTLRDGGFMSCKADPDVWMKPGTKPDGFKYWTYVLVYTDDILCVSHDPKAVMDYLSSRYTLKNGTVAEPDMYLGAQVKKWYFEGSEDPKKPRWAMSSELYVKRAVGDVEMELHKVDRVLPTKVTTPMSQSYRPEIDQTPELNADRGQYYQSLIGVLRWICELG